MVFCSYSTKLFNILRYSYCSLHDSSIIHDFKLIIWRIICFCNLRRKTITFIGERLGHSRFSFVLVYLSFGLICSLTFFAKHGGIGVELKTTTKTSLINSWTWPCTRNVIYSISVSVQREKDWFLNASMENAKIFSKLTYLSFLIPSGVILFEKCFFVFIIFWDFLMFYQIFLSPQVKRCEIIIHTHGIYELPHELWNDLKLRKLGYIKKVSKPDRMIAQCPVPLPRWKFC